MTLISTILVTLVAVEFFYIMYLETIVPTSETTSRVFQMDKQELQRKSVTTLFKNQGIYNGLIGAGLIYSVYFAQATMEMTKFLLIYIILVAAYGSLSSDKKIILTQGGLAIVALISLLV